MKIVIDIDEYLYKTIKTLGLVVEDGDAVAVSKAIANGTPLPKGHGRLIDENDLAKLYDADDRLWWSNAVEKFSDLPTIIEADKGE